MIQTTKKTKVIPYLVPQMRWEEGKKALSKIVCVTHEDSNCTVKGQYLYYFWGSGTVIIYKNDVRVISKF